MRDSLRSIVHLFRVEAKKLVRSPLFWLIHFVPIYKNYQEMSRFVGKGGHMYSKFIDVGILSISEEAMIRVIQFSLLDILLLTIFLFAPRLKEIVDTRFSGIPLSKPISSTKLLLTKTLSTLITFRLDKFYCPGHRLCPDSALFWCSF